MSKMEATRKLLDQLMGVNRNGDKQSLIVDHFWDKRVCKYDLLGLCPHLLFPNTKQDLGPCPFECCPVPEKYKKEYEECPDKESYGYERELESYLDSIIRSCDERIAKARRKLEERQETPTEEPEDLKRVKAEISEVTKKIEQLGNEGKIDEAQILLQRIDALKKEQEAIQAKMPNAKEQQLIVCHVCSALLSVNESDQRLRDHFSGKMHVGLQAIRDKKKELQEKREQNERRYGSRGEYERERSRHRDRERHYRERDYDHDDRRRHYRDRDYRDRDYDRDRRRDYRDYDRYDRYDDRSRSYDRDRDYYRERDSYRRSSSSSRRGDRDDRYSYRDLDRGDYSRDYSRDHDRDYYRGDDGRDHHGGRGDYRDLDRAGGSYRDENKSQSPNRNLNPEQQQQQEQAGPNPTTTTTTNLNAGDGNTGNHNGTNPIHHDDQPRENLLKKANDLD